MDLPAANPPVPTRNTLLPMGQVLPQIVANLKALQANGTNAFDRVEIFTEANLIKAFQALIASDTTVALVIFAGDEFTKELDGEGLRLTGDVEVTILFCSQFMGDPSGENALGGDGVTPGLFTLRDLVLPIFNGVLLWETPQKGRTYAWPHSGECIPVSDPQRGRDVIAYRLTVKLNGGELTTNLGPYPMP